jgi:hypothetical protein
MVLGSIPGQAIFPRGVLFCIPYLADWKKVAECRQKQIDQNNVCKNKNQVEFDFTMG